MVFGKKSVLLIWLGLCLLAMGCSPKGSPTNLSIKFHEKVQGLNNTGMPPVMFLAINVSGPGMNLVSKEWECERVDCSELSLEVRSGSDRLIQLLAVYRDGSTNETQIAYGDVTRELAGGSNQVEIDLKNVASFSREGDIVGRYIPTNNHPLAGRHLTGDVYMWARVDPNKPDMRLESTEMFGGWFNIFVLDTLGFRYTFTGYDQQGNFYENVAVFNDLHGAEGLKLSSPSLQGEGQKIARYSTDIPIFDDRDGERTFPTQVLGFFGANPDNQVLCSSETISPSPVYSGGSGLTEWCKDSLCQTFLTFNDIIVGGDVSGSAITCQTNPASTSTDRPVDLWSMGDGEDMLNILPPFVGPGGMDPYSLDMASGTLSWHMPQEIYLPGGVEVFTANFDSFTEDVISDQKGDLDCHRFADAGLTSLGVRTEKNVEFQLGNILSEGPRPFFLCPRRPDGSYYKSVTEVYDHDHSAGMTMATRLNLRKPITLGDGTADLATGVCHPLLLEALDENGHPGGLPAGFQVVLDSEDTNGNFYSESTCVAAKIIDAPINIKPFREVIYYQTTSSSGGYQLTASTNDGSLTAGTLNLTSIGPGTAASVKLIPEFYRADNLEMANTEQCVPFLLAILDENNRLTTATAVIQLNPNNGAQAYATKANCEAGGTPIPGTDENINGPTYRFYLSQPSTGTTIIENALAYCATTCQPGNIEIVNPGPLDHIHAQRTDFNTNNVNNCLTYKLGAYDNHKPNSYPVVFGPDPLKISTSLNANVYSDDPNCLGTPITNPSVNGISLDGFTHEEINIKANEDGELNILFEYLSEQFSVTEQIDPI